MSGRYIRDLTVGMMFVGGVTLFTPPSFAEDIGDQYYPTSIESISSVEAMEKAHQYKMQAIDAEYKKRMDSLESRYNEKNTTAEAHTNQMIALREKYAALKEERIKKREELENAFLKRSEDLYLSEFEKSNQYVVNVKARKEYFEKKKKKEEDATINN